MTLVSNHYFLYPPTTTKGKVLVVLSFCPCVCHVFLFFCECVWVPFYQADGIIYLLQLHIHLHDFFLMKCFRCSKSLIT